MKQMTWNRLSYLRAARAVRAGAVVAPEHAVGERTWEEFLADQVRPG
jgi:hypothetical protein